MAAKSSQIREITARRKEKKSNEKTVKDYTWPFWVKGLETFDRTKLERMKIKEITVGLKRQSSNLITVCQQIQQKVNNYK